MDTVRLEPSTSVDDRVDVVLPTVGRPSLKAAVDSALAQVRPIHQIILVDDSPMGLTEPFCDIERIVIVQGPRRGAAAARNAGVRASTSPWTAFLDDDDTWRLNKLQTQLDGRSSEDDVVLASGATVHIAGAARSRPKRPIAPDADVLHELFGAARLGRSRVYVPTPSFVVPTRLALKVPFDESLTAREDIWWLHCLQVQGARIVQHPDPLLDVYTDLAAGLARDSWEHVSTWGNRLSTVDPKLAIGFYAGMALRNAVLQADGTAIGRLADRCRELGRPYATRFAAARIAVRLSPGRRSTTVG